jgi:hypothetical protein
MVVAVANVSFSANAGAEEPTTATALAASRIFAIFIMNFLSS